MVVGGGVLDLLDWELHCAATCVSVLLTAGTQHELEQ